MRGYPMKADRALASEMLLQINEKYKGRIDIFCIDTRNIFWFFDLIRFRVKAMDIVWVLNGTVFFRGVPEWALVDSVLAGALGAETQPFLKRDEVGSME